VKPPLAHRLDGSRKPIASLIEVPAPNVLEAMMVQAIRWTKWSVLDELEVALHPGQLVRHDRREKELAAQ